MKKQKSETQSGINWTEMDVETDLQIKNLRISKRIDLQILSSFDLIITTSTSDSDCASASVNSNF